MILTENLTGNLKSFWVGIYLVDAYIKINFQFISFFSFNEFVYHIPWFYCPFQFIYTTYLFSILSISVLNIL